MATLLLELSLTRIFSVLFYHHMAFLAISIAMFGLGAGGVFSYFVADWKVPFFERLGRLSALNGLLVVVALVNILLPGNSLAWWRLALIYFTTALPFVVSGIIVSTAVSATMVRIDRVYFFDLAGAACGCMLLIPLLNQFGGPSTVLGAAVTFAVAAAIWHSMAGSVRGRVGSVALALALTALLTYNQRHPALLDVTHAKEKTLRSEVWSKWNSISRVAIVHQAKGNSDTIVIDADASTAIAHFDFDHLTKEDRHDLLEQGPALPYALRPGAKTLIIGPGGGWDVAHALAWGSHDVTGVEINDLIARTVMQQKPELSGGLYSRPDVHIYVEDGRSFIRRSPDRYQVIQATLVDTWAATTAGAFALSENDLYTTDAFRDYLRHLTNDGVVAFTRWGFDPPRQSLRLVSLAMAALGQLREPEPWRHVVVGRSGPVEGWGAMDTVLIARKPLSADDVERVRTFFRAADMQAVYVPGSQVPNQFHDLLLSPHPEEYESSYSFDISPVSDNRPFFFYTVQPRDLWQFLTTASRQNADFKTSNEAVPLLFGLLFISLAAMALTLLLPPLVLGTRLPRQEGVRGFLWYFLFIGTGYILIEVGLIQRFVLFLGHPTYALTVVIFSLLAFSGAGSFASRRLLGDDQGRLVKALGCVAMLAALLAVVAPGLLTALVGLPLLLKIVITVAMVAPLGFSMGMPFPTALRRLEMLHAPSVRWAWSLNAAASVMGSVVALTCAIYLGLLQTMMIGGLFYLAALVVVARARGEQKPAPEPGPGRVLVSG
jgi:hypothetical protein